MIHTALDYIRREVVAYLGVTNNEVVLGHIHTLKDEPESGLTISLVNLAEESALKNTSHLIRQNGAARYQQPPVHLVLYLLFVANFDDYAASLLRLSQTIELFQQKPAFTAANQSAANPFPATLEKLIFDFYTLNLEQLNHLWGVLGGAYFPSVLYRVRLVRVQRDESTAAPEITTIQVETTVR